MMLHEPAPKLAPRRLVPPLLVLLLDVNGPAVGQVTSGDSAAGPQDGSISVQAEVEYGPGELNLGDTKEGLSGLTGYRATLHLSFSGTYDGKPERWSKSYAMQVRKQPAARRLTIEKSGSLADTESVFIAEVDGVEYERRGGKSCTVRAADGSDSLGERMEPAGFLNGVRGAEAADSAMVNGAETRHYTFDERAFGQRGVAQSTGEIWIASQGGYVVRYVLATRGNSDYFGPGTEGTLTSRYDLTEIAQPQAIEVPGDCPAGRVDAPMMQGAANVVSVPGLLTFNVTTDPSQAAEFYQKQLPALGWRPADGDSTVGPLRVLNFERGEETLTVLVSTSANLTRVRIAWVR